MTSTTNKELNQYDDKSIEMFRNSLFPGAKKESVIMVIEYCRHARLDIMLKPVHIVPMWIFDREKGEGETRDVIMPGINLYRIQASRSGCAGISEPEFGDDVIECLGGIDITYPKWCKITVKRIIGNQIVEFTAKEFWKENYATAGKDKKTGAISQAPNTMWKKRPYGQLAKCAEAQALRKAFPEICALPTAEEMEGKNLSSEEYEEIQKNKIIHGKGVQGLKERLGLIEEKNQESNEADQLSGAEQVTEVVQTEERDINKDLIDISWCDDIDKLKDVYSKAYKYWMNKKHKENMQRCVEEKNKKLAELEANKNLESHSNV